MDAVSIRHTGGSESQEFQSTDAHPGSGTFMHPFWARSYRYRFTGSFQFITFVLALIVFALEEELNMPTIGQEGQFGILVGSSRELMRQTFEVVQNFTDAVSAIGFITFSLSYGEDKRTNAD